MGRFGVKTPKRKRSADILIFGGEKTRSMSRPQAGFLLTALQWHDVVPPRENRPSFFSNIYNIEINFVERKCIPGHKRDVSFN